VCSGIMSFRAFGNRTLKSICSFENRAEIFRAFGACVAENFVNSKIFFKFLLLECSDQESHSLSRQFCRKQFCLQLCRKQFCLQLSEQFC
jgi:hypothetical protein